jgi:cysteine protease ATG4
MKVIGSNPSHPSADSATLLKAIPRFCYRKRFPLIPHSKLTSDSGWGCCFRSCQGVLAQFCLRLQQLMPDKYLEVFPATAPPLSLFFDCESSLFGLHRLVVESDHFGISVGQWGRPSVIANAIQSIFTALHLGSLVNHGLSISKDNFPTTFPAIVLISCQFGLDSLDPKFVPFLQLCLGNPLSLGFVSGYRDSAYFVVGFSTTHFGYFDPHTTLKAALDERGFSSFFSHDLKALKSCELNPSILLAFFAGSAGDLDNLLAELAQGPGSPLSVVDPVDDALCDQVLDIDDL